MKAYLILAASCLCITVAAADMPVDSGLQAIVSKAYATVDIVPGQPRVTVRITNISKIPLEAWRTRITYEDGSASAKIFEVTTDSYLGLSLNGPPRPDIGPIPFNGFREQTFMLPSVPRSGVVELLMLTFSDALSEGDRDEVAKVFAAREHHAEALGLILEAIDAASGRPAEEARAIISSGLSSRTVRLTQLSSNARVKATQLSVTELLSSGDAPETFGKRMANLRQQLAHQRQLALRHKVGR